MREQHCRIYTTVRDMDSQWEAAVWHRELSSGLCDDLEGGGGGIREGGPKGRDTGMHIAGPLRCTAETNTAFQSNYACMLSLLLSYCFFPLFFLTIFKIVHFQINFFTLECVLCQRRCHDMQVKEVKGLVFQLCPISATPHTTVVYQAPLAMGFSRQEY